MLGKRISICIMGILLILLALAGTGSAVDGSELTLTLNNTMDGSSTPLVNNITNITSAVLLDTSGNTVESATSISSDGMTAQFSLSGISRGDYFIKVNDHAGALVPTRIDSNASDINQSVGRRLRNSVISNNSNPTLYRIKSYPSEISSSHPVVNYVTGANESKYTFLIVSNSTSKIEVRVLNTSEELSNFSTSNLNHDSYADPLTHLQVSFQIWILGDVKNPADPTGVAFLGNHGHLFNASTDPTTFVCSGCHANLGTKPATFPPTVSNGFCFRCHNGPGGPSQGFVDPKVVAANGTIKGTVANASSGQAISSATVTADGQSNVTDVNGNYSISIVPGTYSVTANANGYNMNSTSGIVVGSGATVTQNFALTTGAIVNGTIMGTVTNVSSGSAIAGATVAADSQSNITDVNGNYTISIGSGTYTLTASATGYQSNSTSVTVTSGATVTQNFALTTGAIVNGTIMGTVTNMSSGSAIAGATVAADSQSNITDANGNYTISIGSGTYTLTASATGYQSTSKSVTVTSGATFTQNFALTPGVAPTFNISGFKIDNDTGMGLANWNIKLTNPDSTVVGNMTDSNGMYKFMNLMNGTYTISEVLQDGWTNVSPMSIAVTINGMDMMNQNFTNAMLPPQPIVTSFGLTPSKTAVLNGSSITITVQALNVTLIDTNFNGMANITVNASKNASAVIYPPNVTFNNGIAILTVTSNIVQFVTVTATNGSITGSTDIVFADRVFDLDLGWNLISIPNFAVPIGIDLALKNVKNNGVVGYDPATKNFSTPTDLQPLYGYWINVTAPNQSIGFIADTNTTSVPPSRNLYEGWNLIGVVADEQEQDNKVDAGLLFQPLQIGGKPLYSFLVSYKDPRHTYAINADLTVLTPLNQGQGYWLFINTMTDTNKNSVIWAGKPWLPN